jgi:hypothetical protein
MPEIEWHLLTAGLPRTFTNDVISQEGATYSLFVHSPIVKFDDSRRNTAAYRAGKRNFSNKKLLIDHIAYRKTRCTPFRIRASPLNSQKYFRALPVVFARTSTEEEPKAFKQFHVCYQSVAFPASCLCLTSEASISLVSFCFVENRMTVSDSRRHATADAKCFSRFPGSISACFRYRASMSV